MRRPRRDRIGRERQRSGGRRAGNGNVYTADAHNTVRQALAIRDGRIVFVGSDRKVRAYVGKRTKVTNLHGRMAMPGLVDGHMHPLAGGAGLLKCSLEYLPLTVQEIRARIAKCLADTASKGPDAWLEVTSWYQEAMLPPGAKLTAADLDDLSPTRPIIVTSSFFHATVVNSAVMRLAGITAATPDRRAAPWIAMRPAIRPACSSTRPKNWSPRRCRLQRRLSRSTRRRRR